MPDTTQQFWYDGSPVPIFGRSLPEQDTQQYWYDGTVFPGAHSGMDDIIVRPAAVKMMQVT